jgi:hypothetical protein
MSGENQNHRENKSIIWLIIFCLYLAGYLLVAMDNMFQLSIF